MTEQFSTTQKKEEKTTLNPQIITEQISSTELITNIQIKNSIKLTTTETIEEKEQTTKIKIESTDAKTTNHYIDNITNKIDITDTPNIVEYTHIEKNQTNTTKIETTEITEEHTHKKKILKQYHLKQ